MQRRQFIATAITSALAIGVNRGVFAAKDSASSPGGIPALNKTDEEWKKLLNAQQYNVMFEEATERPWTSELNDEKREGTYLCAACYFPLFKSDTKFDSGTGWPSFYKPIKGNMGTKRDWKLIIPRTEYHCARCGSHQGHVFNDGPKPTGERWCNNGVALKFIPSAESLPALRT
jgi:peptide-methionine (R)-S-oxide reductase